MSGINTPSCKRIMIELSDGTTYDIDMHEGRSDLKLDITSEPIETAPEAGLFRRFVGGPLMVKVELRGEAQSVRRVA